MIYGNIEFFFRSEVSDVVFHICLLFLDSTRQ